MQKLRWLAFFTGIGKEEQRYAELYQETYTLNPRNGIHKFNGCFMHTTWTSRRNDHSRAMTFWRGIRSRAVIVALIKVTTQVSQPIEFNWVLKVKDPVKYTNSGVGAEIKGGYRVFPMSWQINLVDWSFVKHANVRVTQTQIKRTEDITEEDAIVCGFKNIEMLRHYLDKEYPDSMELVTIVSFLVL